VFQQVNAKITFVEHGRRDLKLTV